MILFSFKNPSFRSRKMILAISFNELYCFRKPYIRKELLLHKN